MRGCGGDLLIHTQRGCYIPLDLVSTGTSPQTEYSGIDDTGDIGPFVSGCEQRCKLPKMGQVTHIESIPVLPLNDTSESRYVIIRSHPGLQLDKAGRQFVRQYPGCLGGSCFAAVIDPRLKK